MSAEHHEDEHGHQHTWTPPSELEARVRALESLLVEKGRASSEAIDALVERYEKDVGPMIGATVIARAWTDDEFKQRLLEDADGAIREMDLVGLEAEHMHVVENTPDEHNVVVCTLCSCYPWGLLGLPPAWYKSPAYRSRTVREPRAVLSEFGLEVDEGAKVTVWDSSADTRFLVLPERPEGTEGWSEEELAQLVTRDSMIGVAKALEPEAAPA